MRSKVADRMMAKMPEETKIFVDKYADIVVRVNQLLAEKGLSQKDLAEKMDKAPSEISKWLKGEHNFTLRSIAKLEAELGETILYVPQRKTIVALGSGDDRKRNFTICKIVLVNAATEFIPLNPTPLDSKTPVANVS